VRAQALVLLVLALTLTGCETTAEKSAKLEKQALKADSPGPVAVKGLSIGRESTAIKVLATALLRNSEGGAVAITLQNLSAHAQAEVPIGFTVRDSRGNSLYSNSTAGLAHSLVSVPLIAAHGEMTWIDDQVTAASTGTITAKVGEGTTAQGPLPPIAVSGGHLFEEPGSGFAVKGTVVNRSSVSQRELVVYATARRSGRLVAAGRSVLAEVPAGGSVPFQVFFIGDPRGAELQFSAPPSTLR
jgi:hypothetical protein